MSSAPNPTEANTTSESRNLSMNPVKRITSVQLKDQTVVTSGIYERYFKKNGKLYHHILDPRTGYPCENNLYSVSIITDSSTKADALSTTCFLLGYEKGMELIQSMDGVKAIFITDDEKVHKIGI